MPATESTDSPSLTWTIAFASLAIGVALGAGVSIIFDPSQADIAVLRRELAASKTALEENATTLNAALITAQQLRLTRDALNVELGTAQRRMALDAQVIADYEQANDQSNGGREIDPDQELINGSASWTEQARESMAWSRRKSQNAPPPFDLGDEVLVGRQFKSEIGSLIPELSIRVTEEAESYQTHSWKLELKNGLSRDVKPNVEIHWRDRDGFILDSAWAVLGTRIGPGLTEKFSGTWSVSLELVPRVAQVTLDITE